LTGKLPVISREPALRSKAQDHRATLLLRQDNVDSKLPVTWWQCHTTYRELAQWS